MSFMRCVVFETLKAFGKGMRVVSNWLRYFSSLYAGVLIELTMDLIGHWVLCTFGRPRMLGGVGFMWVSLVLVSPGIREGHVLIVVFILFWNKFGRIFFKDCEVVFLDELLNFKLIVIEV